MLNREVGDDSGVSLLSYEINGETELLWGKKIPLCLAGDRKAPFVLDGNWVLEEGRSVGDQSAHKQYMYRETLYILMIRIENI